MSGDPSIAQRRAFELSRVIQLPAGVDEVWQAISTGSGQQAWLYPARGEIPARVGDTIGDHRVEVWAPPHRLALRADDGAGYVDAVEYVVEPAETGGSVLRYRHEGVVDGDWENAYDSADQHLDLYLHTLGQYLEYFAGDEAVYIGAQAHRSSAVPGSFDRVRQALGIRPDAVEGDRVYLEVLGAAPVDGVIDYLRTQFIGVRSGSGLYRFFGRDAFARPIALGHHLFDSRVDQLETSAWGAWLEGLFTAV